MDPNGDITDAFDDDALARSIEAGKSGPWKDDSAEFEDPRLTKVSKDLVTPKATDYQHRRIKELQERAAQQEASGAAAATAPAEPKLDLWGEPQTSTWDEQDSPSTEHWQDDSEAVAAQAETTASSAPQTDSKPRVTGPVAKPPTTATPAAAPSPAASSGKARVWLTAVVVIAAAAVGYWLVTGA